MASGASSPSWAWKANAGGLRRVSSKGFDSRARSQSVLMWSTATNIAECRAANCQTKLVACAVGPWFQRHNRPTT